MFWYLLNIYVLIIFPKQTGHGNPSWIYAWPCRAVGAESVSCGLLERAWASQDTDGEDDCDENFNLLGFMSEDPFDKALLTHTTMSAYSNLNQCFSHLSLMTYDINDRFHWWQMTDMFILIWVSMEASGCQEYSFFLKNIQKMLLGGGKVKSIFWWNSPL